MASDSVNEVGKYIKKTRKDTDFALQRYHQTIPVVERTRDLFNADLPFGMTFKTKRPRARVLMDLNFNKPPPLLNNGSGGVTPPGGDPVPVDCFSSACESFTVASGDHLITLNRPYVAGTITVLFNGVVLPRTQYSETSPGAGTIFIQDQAGAPPPVIGDIGGTPSLRGVKPYGYGAGTAVAAPYGLTQIHAARDAAGVGGTLLFPAAGSPYNANPIASTASQTWRAENAGVLINGTTTPANVGLTFEGGQWRNFHFNRPSQSVANFTGRNLTVQSLSGIGVTVEGPHNNMWWKNCEWYGQTADFFKTFYDQPGDGDFDGLKFENTIMSVAGNNHSAIAGNDGNQSNSIKNFVVTNAYIDSGAIMAGDGFGIEVWHHIPNSLNVGGVVEYSDLRGGGFLISMVRSINNYIHHNRFSLGNGGAYAAYEAGGYNHTGARIQYNTVNGSGGGAFVYHDASSHHCTITQNQATNIGFFLQGNGDGGGYTITNNCYSNVGSFGGTGYVIPNIMSNNGVNGCTPTEHQSDTSMNLITVCYSYKYC